MLALKVSHPFCESCLWGPWPRAATAAAAFAGKETRCPFSKCTGSCSTVLLRPYSGKPSNLQQASHAPKWRVSWNSLISFFSASSGVPSSCRSTLCRRSTYRRCFCKISFCSCHRLSNRDLNPQIPTVIDSKDVTNCIPHVEAIRKGKQCGKRCIHNSCARQRGLLGKEVATRGEAAGSTSTAILLKKL